MICMGWLARRATAIILPVMAMVASAQGVPAKTRDCPAPMLAMTYNIRLDTSADGENAWPYRRDFLIGQILVLRPAILGMQEVLPNQRQDLEAGLPGYAFFGGGRDDGKLAGEASPIAVDRSIFRIRDSGMFWLSPTPDLPSRGWDAAFPRVASWVRLKGRRDGKSLLVVNTHWDHVGVLARQSSGQLLARWIASHRLANEEVVLLGDFNTVSSDPALLSLHSPDAGLRDARQAAERGTSGPDYSFNGFSAEPEGRQLIDHIFASAGVGVIKHMVLAESDRGRFASDHFPVVALLSLSNGRDEGGCG